MKYVVLLRGVNVGGRTVKSAELKDCFVRAGFEDAQTVLATGNVIISSNKTAQELKPEIEGFLLASFGFPITVCVIGEQKIAKITADYPFDNNPDFHRYVIFKDSAVELPNLKLNNKLEAVQLDDSVVYWRVLKGHTLDSDFAKLSAKVAAKSFSTTRNLNTLEKILTRL